MLLTGIDLAEKSGISRKSITLALSQGRILRPGKEYDTKDPGIREFVQKAHDNKARVENAELPASWQGVLREDDSPEIREEPAAHKPPSTPRPPDQPNQNPTDTADGQTKTKVDIRKGLAMCRKLDLEHEKAMGELIPRKLVESLLGNIGSAVTNHIFPLGGRLANQVCAILEVTDPEKVLMVKGMIDGEIMPALAEVKRETELKVLDND